jgi:hypothetical protein
VRELLQLSREELDDLFRASTAGELPDGHVEGIFLAVPLLDVSRLASALIRLLAWRGKVFDAARGEVVNEVLPFRIRAVRAHVRREPSLLDGAEAIVLDYSQTSFVARAVRDELREISPGTYLGLVYWGRAKVGSFALRLSP